MNITIFSLTETRTILILSKSVKSESNIETSELLLLLLILMNRMLFRFYSFILF